MSLKPMFTPLTVSRSHVPLVAEAIECEWNPIQCAKETHVLTVFLLSYCLTVLQCRVPQLQPLLHWVWRNSPHQIHKPGDVL